MCGIAGLLLVNKQTTPSEALLWAMVNRLKHRGPDAQHVLAQPGLGLAHARLSIIDLCEKADQPMLDEENGNLIVYNGEIYNYIELRETLQSLGHRFQTRSDTEVILKAYAQWGMDCLNRFNGMWAFVIYDKQAEMAFGARDRLGVKPFIYGVTPGDNTLVFASEAKAIVQAFPQFNAVNHDFLTHFIEKDFFACYKETFYRGLFNLLPGHYFIVAHGQVPVQQRYWHWTPAIEQPRQSDLHIVGQFKELLEDSIRLRFRSDVPVGSCLSGGMDSSTLVGLATGLFKQPLQSFSCIYPNTPTFDESQYIQSSVAKFNCIARYTEPDADAFIQLMHDSVIEQDGPTGGPSILSQRAVMALAGQHVKVLLDGQGADEVLGGYHSYFRHSLQSHLRGFRHRLSIKSLRDFFLNAKAIEQRTGRKIGPLPALLYMMRKSASFYTAKQEETSLQYLSAFKQDDLNTLLLEHTFTNLPNLLHYEDRNSMRFSVESRLPFLDYRLVEFAFSLPHTYKIRGSTTKWLLNQVASDILPADVLHRKDKMGFTTPAHQWFLQNNNIEHFRKYIQPESALFAGLSPGMQDYLEKSFHALAALDKGICSPAAGGDVNALWRLFTANIWVESIGKNIE